ncbi:hypothetical protein XELAEV_18009074mg [Xenopus laevis]|uniref:Protein kinase domain-containing protein n=1 Tax=Xenopus laevis TaxID=8355 RepID=A0A974I0G1_XENLA|nr:hypothetical protein XELAEV_18009074mg [Xenopus laevis]
MLATFANRKLAVTIIKKSPECNYNSIRIEASVLMMPHLNPFLCQGYSTFETQRHIFMVMDYLNGGSLARHLEFYRSLEPETVLFHSAEIVCGLEFLHSCGIVHRNTLCFLCYGDLKPDNILLDQDGHVKISGFGLAVPNMFGNKTIGGRAGTMGYMAPEVLQRKRYNAAVYWWALLEKNSDQRLGDENTKHHPFFSYINWVELENKNLPSHFQLRAVST